MRRRSPFVYVILVLIAALSFILADRTLPPEHLPWRTLDVDAPLGFATGTQLMRVSLAPASVCRDHAMGSSTLISVDADAHRPGNGCGWGEAQIFQGSREIDLSPGGVTMQCPLMLGAHIWLQEVNLLAQDIFNEEILRVHHAGTYACRLQVGNNSGRRSEHSYANAWDVTAFTLSNQRMIKIEDGWRGDKDVKSFLKQARNKACRLFRVTLSPDYNAAHADHFHLDMGPSLTCR